MRVLVPFLALVMVALAGCSKGARDADGDGLRDSTEEDWPALIVDYMERRVRLTDVTSDTDVLDTDGDGLSDFDELFRKTHPRIVDTDQDGLTDCQESVHRNRSECEDPNYAGDYDGGTGTSPVRADSDPGPVRYLNMGGRFVDESGTLPDGIVDWGDGISDADELAGYPVQLSGGRTRQVVSDPRDSDTDADGLEDGEELYLYAGDPTVPDTDGDACADGEDPFPSLAETYSFGLTSFTLLRDLDGDRGADLQMVITLGSRSFKVPPSGSLDVRQGDPYSLQAFDPAPFPLNDCPMEPGFPWLQVQVIAIDSDVSATQPIDLSSTTPGDHRPGQSAALWWNVREGTFSAEPDGAPLAEARFRGQDAELLLAPTVPDAQGA